MEQEKKWYLSKTLWINIAAVAAAFFPGIKDKLTPEQVTYIISGINVVMRIWFTEDKLIK